MTRSPQPCEDDTTLPASDDYRACRLCPRNCGVDRLSGQTGYCGETAVCRVADIGTHRGEEPSFSGTRGSGTVFFSGCSCQCFFCQNYQISHDGLGGAISPSELLERIARLAATGVHNINFVTGDHFWPHVEDVARALRSNGVRLPFLLNSSGYHRPEMISRYAELMDIFLPDFKFLDSTLTARCMNAPDYARYALASLRLMVEAKGFLAPWDTDGAEPAQTGVLVRHLVLPGQASDSIAILELLRAEFGRWLPLSIMSQYAPNAAAREKKILDTRISRDDYRRVCDAADRLDFRHLYIQQDFGDDNYFPDFEQELPFASKE